MEPTISVYFDNDRTYVALMEEDAKGISLAYINSTTMPIDFSDSAPNSAEAFSELENMLWEIAGAAMDITVSLPMESVFAHQFPAPASFESGAIQPLLQFEISQYFPHQKPDDFHFKVYPLAPQLNGSQMALAIIMEKNAMSIAQKALKALGATIKNYDVAQLSAHTLFAYNYPEYAENTIVLFGVQGKYIDVSVLKKNELAYYHLAPLNSPDDIGTLCADELEKILDEYVPYVDSAFFFGSQLTDAMFRSASSYLSVPVTRLNAFRMTTTTLGARERQYCSRVAHILPPCIGSALPSIHTPVEF